MKKLNFPYVIFNSEENLVDAEGESTEDVTLANFYVNEKAALDDIKTFYLDHGKREVYYVAQITLLKRVSPPSEITVEVL